MPGDRFDIGKFAASTGFLIDRCVKREEPFGTVWLVDKDVAVTCAHLLVLYEDFLRGLKVHFPATNQEWEVTEVIFHSRFDRKVAHEMAKRSLAGQVPALALQDQNMALLKLSPKLSELSPEAATSFNRKLSLSPLPRMKGLVGSVEELGLDLVIQTVVNARKDGVLVIADERNRPLAKIYCREGNLLYAKFRNLRNEQALYQMFAHHMAGQFTFQAATKPDWMVEVPITKTTQGLLLEAHRRMDEMPRLLRELGGIGAAYTRVREVVDPASLPADDRDNAVRIWWHLDGGLSIDQLWEVVDLDDHTIYQILVDLLKTKQIVEIGSLQDDKLSPMQPLEMAPHMLLVPWDDVYSLTVHPTIGRPQIRKGNLVGLLRPNDPYHMLHTLNLPYRAAGSPIMKDGSVVGLHCGMLPLDPQMHALPQQLNQMLWVESVRQCLECGGKNVPSKPSKDSQGLKRQVGPKPDPQSGITCPQCSSVMQKHAKFCGTCGQRLSA